MTEGREETKLILRSRPLEFRKTRLFAPDLRSHHVHTAAATTTEAARDAEPRKQAPEMCLQGLRGVLLARGRGRQEEGKELSPVRKTQPVTRAAGRAPGPTPKGGEGLCTPSPARQGA